ncbi:hypothetical protein [[Pseudomonas] boreopolis]|uniref:hypothetical protein n=1 Tax=Xanthomonas boreopolis TaxID=86183 RepID=UPI003D9AD861
MAAAAIKSIVGIALVMLAGCHVDRSAIALSERYRVCAHFPSSVAYQSEAPGPDFDLGSLKVEGMTVDVFIGGHPRFSHQVMKKGVEATDGFRLLGKERSDEQDKLLFAYERGDKEGPIYVMFMAPDLRTAERVLTKKNLLVSCR